MDKSKIVKSVEESKSAHQASTESMGTRKFNTTFNELKAIQTTVRSFKPIDLVVPLLSLISLTLLSIFVYVPMITSGIGYLNEESASKIKLTKLSKLSNSLDSIDSAQIQKDLSDARAVIPYSLQVSDFVSYVDKLAQSKGLVFKEILAGDIVVRDGTDRKGSDPVMRGVSGPVKYSGSLSQITEFFDDLQSTSPFILSADQIVMKKKEDSSNWEIALNITGFYLDKNSIPKLDLYADFIPYTTYQSVMEKFAKKAKDLESNN